MTLDLTNDELLTSTRAVRLRLDFDRPFPIAYTKGVDFKATRRLAPEAVTHWNAW